MILHKKKILLIATGVITLVVLTGILALLLNIDAFVMKYERSLCRSLWLVKGGPWMSR